MRESSSISRPSLCMLTVVTRDRHCFTLTCACLTGEDVSRNHVVSKPHPCSSSCLHICGITSAEANAWRWGRLASTSGLIMRFLALCVPPTNMVADFSMCHGVSPCPILSGSVVWVFNPGLHFLLHTLLPSLRPCLCVVSSAHSVCSQQRGLCAPRGWLGKRYVISGHIRCLIRQTLTFFGVHMVQGYV